MFGGGVVTPINKTETAIDVSPEDASLTDAYADGWVSGWISAPLAQYVRLLLTLTTSDADSFELRLEVEDSSGTDGFTTLRISSGTASIDEVQITPAAASATERYAVQVFVPDCRRFRVRAKETGAGSTAPTLTLEYVLDSAAPEQA